VVTADAPRDHKMTLFIFKRDDTEHLQLAQRTTSCNWLHRSGTYSAKNKYVHF